MQLFKLLAQQNLCKVLQSGPDADVRDYSVRGGLLSLDFSLGALLLLGLHTEGYQDQVWRPDLNASDVLFLSLTPADNMAISEHLQD